MRRLDVETRLVMSTWAEATNKYETDYHQWNAKSLPDHVHSINEMAAPISRGYFKTDGMIDVPCSMKMLAAIHSGFRDDLVLRTANVVLKKRRKLVLVARDPTERYSSAQHVGSLSEWRDHIFSSARILYPGCLRGRVE